MVNQVIVRNEVQSFFNDEVPKVHREVRNIWNRHGEGIQNRGLVDAAKENLARVIEERICNCVNNLAQLSNQQMNRVNRHGEMGNLVWRIINDDNYTAQEACDQIMSIVGEVIRNP